LCFENDGAKLQKIWGSKGLAGNETKVLGTTFSPNHSSLPNTTRVDPNKHFANNHQNISNLTHQAIFSNL